MLLYADVGQAGRPDLGGLLLHSGTVAPPGVHGGGGGAGRPERGLASAFGAHCDVVAVRVHMLLRQYLFFAAPKLSRVAGGRRDATFAELAAPRIA